MSVSVLELVAWAREVNAPDLYGDGEFFVPSQYRGTEEIRIWLADLGHDWMEVAHVLLREGHDAHDVVADIKIWERNEEGDRFMEGKEVAYRMVRNVEIETLPPVLGVPD